jgi:hypothetical protein
MSTEIRVSNNSQKNFKNHEKQWATALFSFKNNAQLPSHNCRRTARPGQPKNKKKIY